jgi:arylsulfatase
MPDELKPVLARQMEVYAGFLEHTDHHVGRLVDGLADIGVLDDTLIYYVIGDNGASAEGTPNGCFNELITLNGAAGLETAEFMASKIDDFGTPAAYNHYAVGWAHAMDTPFQWTKQVASHWGGTRNGTIVHWPNGFSSRGEVRSQFHHVIDVATTILDAAGLPHPQSVNGITQMPLHGVSMVPTFDAADAPETRTTQYFEMFCNRGIYHEGWTAVTRHSTPWVMGPMPAFDDDVWELYGPDDWTQAHDLAAEEPERLRDLQRLWLLEATKYQVLPLDDRRVERFDPGIAGRPQLIQGSSQLLFSGMTRLSENSLLVVKNRSHSVTAEVEIPDGGADGVIIAQGGAFGGWSLYLKDGGRPAYCYNLFGIQQTVVEGPEPVRAGDHQVRMEFTSDGGGLGKGGGVELFVDGQRVGEGRLEATVPVVFSADETADLGSDSATPVSSDYTAKDSVFTGRIGWVQIDVDEAAEDLDHLISPEERLRIAMARQ